MVNKLPLRLLGACWIGPITRASQALAMAARRCCHGPVTALSHTGLLLCDGMLLPTATALSRFLPGQKFDLQAMLQPDAGSRITSVSFAVDDQPVASLRHDGGEADQFDGNTSLVKNGLSQHRRLSQTESAHEHTV
jgi:hypothetical protein